MAIRSRKFKAGPDTWLYTYEYHDIVDKLPDIETLIDIVASVHKDSMANSPKGKFEFNVPTHLANIPSDNAWQDTREEWFLQAMKSMYAFETQTNTRL